MVMDYVQRPRDLIQTNKFVTLTADVMYVNSLPFVITYWRGIGLMLNQAATQFACNLKRNISLYSSAGFIIQTILVDMEFDKFVPEIPDVVVNTSAASEHVAEVERQIRVVKERCQACLAVMPFKKIPNIMTMNLVHFCVFWLNATPVKTGISPVYSPRKLIS